VADTPAGRAAAEALEDAATVLQGHFDRSNFAIEMHQAFLDLVVAGTGLLMVEEAPLGEASAFRFAAVPLRNAVLEEGPSGRLDTVYRTAPLALAAIRSRYPAATLPPALAARRCRRAPPGSGSGLAGPRGHPLRRAAHGRAGPPGAARRRAASPSRPA
jgi:hypothetical protein